MECKLLTLFPSLMILLTGMLICSYTSDIALSDSAPALNREREDEKYTFAELEENEEDLAPSLMPGSARYTAGSASVRH